MDLPFVLANGQEVYRVARRPDPWSPPDWAYVHEDKTFGNRFDDAEGYFRVLYAGSTRFACFLETLARFRKAPIDQLASELDQIAYADSDHIQMGTVPGSWLAERKIGRALLKEKRFANVHASEWIAHLRNRFEAELLSREVTTTGNLDFDLGLLLSQDRFLTQQIATHVYRLGFDGICYQSRHGGELMNWAIFEPFKLKDQEHLDITAEDLDFKKALHHFDLAFDPQL